MSTKRFSQGYCFWAVTRKDTKITKYLNNKKIPVIKLIAFKIKQLFFLIRLIKKD